MYETFLLIICATGLVLAFVLLWLDFVRQKNTLALLLAVSSIWVYVQGIVLFEYFGEFSRMYLADVFLMVFILYIFLFVPKGLYSIKQLEWDLPFVFLYFFLVLMIVLFGYSSAVEVALILLALFVVLKIVRGFIHTKNQVGGHMRLQMILILVLGLIGLLNILFLAKIGDSSDWIKLATLGWSYLGIGLLWGVIYLPKEPLKNTPESLDVAPKTQLPLVQVADKNLVRLYNSVMLHQLKTPLTVIVGYLSMMVEDKNPKYLLNETTYKDLGMVYMSAKRMQSMVTEFLRDQEIKGGNLKLINTVPIDIEEMMRELVMEKDFLRRQNHRNIQICNNTLRAPYTLGDVHKLKEALGNLVDNAIYYGQENITITIEEYPDEVGIVIKDDGIGMSEDQIAKFGQKSVRDEMSASVNPQGSGLGVYIAKSMIELHNGQILVQSAGQNQGTKVTVLLTKYTQGV
jgi:signal transduction histidine kinase